MMNRNILMFILSITLHVLVISSFVYITSESWNKKNQAQWEAPIISIALTQAVKQSYPAEIPSSHVAPAEINTEILVEKAVITVPKKQKKIAKKTEEPITRKSTTVVKNTESPKKTAAKKTAEKTEIAQQQNGDHVPSQSLGSRNPITQQASGTVDNQLINAYREKLRQEIERHKQYPRRAKKMKDRGIAKVQFQLNQKGEISLIRLASSSGSELLDNAALLAVQKSNSVGQPPVGFAQSITLNIEFN